MTIQTALPSDDPMMVAFGKYQQTPEYQNSFKWAEFDQHRDGSMWAAFTEGYRAAQSELAARAAPHAGVEAVMALADKWEATAQAEFDLFTTTKQFWRDQRRLVWLDCAKELRAALTAPAAGDAGGEG